MISHNNLKQIYEKRFSGHESYRNKVWKILISNFFSKWINPDDHILDLGCGYGEFINQVDCKMRYAIDLNPKTKDLLDNDINFHQQDCAQPWDIKPESLDLVFTSNFFEHLPNKDLLNRTMEEIGKALKPGGRVVAMGPNISILKGRYWDFWDHHVALSDASLGELLEIHSFNIEYSVSKFLPYNMVRVKKRPLFLLSLYLKLPLAWFFLGKQFLIVARKN
jgi:SAM-dependent methyltransferase